MIHSKLSAKENKVNATKIVTTAGEYVERRRSRTANDFNKCWYYAWYKYTGSVEHDFDIYLIYLENFDIQMFQG